MDRNELIAELRKGIEVIRQHRITRAWYSPLFEKWVRVMALENGRERED